MVTVTHGAATLSDARYSAVSWGAILAGAFAGAALALLLLMVGTGLGLSAASPWAGEGLPAKAIGIGAVLWMVVTHLLSSAATGYIAGRLRTRWEGLDGDEVVFRDTAHGLVGWAVGIVISALLLAQAASMAIGTTAKAGAEAASTVATAGAAAGAAKAADGNDDGSYLTDTLFRTQGPGKPVDAAVRQEAGRILANAAREGDMPPADRARLAQLIASNTGMSAPDAEKRVNEVIERGKQIKAKAQETADAARKAAAHFAMWGSFALLLGALTASFVATLGGRLRDQV